MVLVHASFEGSLNSIYKDMLGWYLLILMIRKKLQTKNQNPYYLPCLSRNTRSIQDRKQLRPEPGKIEMIKWSAVEAQDEWVISMEDKLEQANREEDGTRWEKHTIYRIPDYLREDDMKLYFPETVSLGPYHHGRKRLRLMECHKWRAVNMILKRTGQGIKMYINAMRELEEKARDCYQGTLSLSSNEFTEMLVLDGCFVLELLRGAHQGFSVLGYGRNDPIFAMRGAMQSIQLDMVMLENQLPLFVLNRLLEIQLGTQYQAGLVAQLAIRFFHMLMPTYNKPRNNEIMFNPFADKDKEGLHCLDVFRRSLLRSNRKPEPWLSRRKWSQNKRQLNLIRSVTELREVGIEFRRRKTDPFSDIRFENGCLEIPKLLIHEGSKTLFSNLIALEQCHTDPSNDITSYIVFMDNMIKSHKDVSYLNYCGIIEHWLGSNAEVAELFNRLCQNIIFDPQNSYLSEVSNQVSYHCSRKWNVFMGGLRHKYFNHPWAYFSSAAAFIMLILTIFQCSFSIFTYYKPKL